MKWPGSYRAADAPVTLHLTLEDGAPPWPLFSATPRRMLNNVCLLIFQNSVGRCIQHPLPLAAIMNVITGRFLSLFDIRPPPLAHF